MGTAIFVVAVAAVYIALGGVSSALAYTPSDAWTVWLASGTMLGLLLACRRERRAAILGGAALGAALFSVLLDDVRPLDALGYAAIEVLAAFAGLYVFGWISPLPTRLERPRDLAALVVAPTSPARSRGRSSLVGKARSSRRHTGPRTPPVLRSPRSRARRAGEHHLAAR